MKYKARLRGFDLAKIEDIVKYSTERYFDTETGRQIAIGPHVGSVRTVETAREITKKYNRILTFRFTSIFYF